MVADFNRVRGTAGIKDATQGQEGGRGGVDKDVDGESGDAFGACLTELVCPLYRLVVVSLTPSSTHTQAGGVYNPRETV